MRTAGIGWGSVPVNGRGGWPGGLSVCAKLTQPANQRWACVPERLSQVSAPPWASERAKPASKGPFVLSSPSLILPLPVPLSRSSWLSLKTPSGSSQGKGPRGFATPSSLSPSSSGPYQRARARSPALLLPLSSSRCVRVSLLSVRWASTPKLCLQNLR